MMDWITIFFYALGGGLFGFLNSRLKNQSPYLRYTVAGFAIAIPLFLAQFAPVRTMINRHILQKSAFESEMELFERYANQDPSINSYKFTNPSNKSAEVQKLTQNGLYFLNLEDLDSWNQIRLRLAKQSTFICAGFVRGGLTTGDLMPAFQKLSDEEAKAWVRTTKQALVLGLQNKETLDMKNVALQFANALGSLKKVIPDDEYKKITEGLVGFMALDESSICEVAMLLHQGAKKLPPEERRELLRTMAPLR